MILVVSTDDIYEENIVRRETHSRELDRLGTALNPHSQIASIFKDKYHSISFLLTQVLC